MTERLQCSLTPRALRRRARRDSANPHLDYTPERYLARSLTACFFAATSLFFLSRSRSFSSAFFFASFSACSSTSFIASSSIAQSSSDTSSSSKIPFPLPAFFVGARTFFGGDFLTTVFLEAGTSGSESDVSTFFLTTFLATTGFFSTAGGGGAELANKPPRAPIGRFRKLVFDGFSSPVLPLSVVLDELAPRKFEDPPTAVEGAAFGLAASFPTTLIGSLTFPFPLAPPPPPPPSVSARAFAPTRVMPPYSNEVEGAHLKPVPSIEGDCNGRSYDVKRVIGSNGAAERE